MYGLCNTFFTPSLSPVPSKAVYSIGVGRWEGREGPARTRIRVHICPVTLRSLVPRLLCAFYLLLAWYFFSTFLIVRGQDSSKDGCTLRLTVFQYSVLCFKE